MGRLPHLILGLVVSGLSAGRAPAQQPRPADGGGGVLYGRVTDVDGQPVRYASVAWVRQRRQPATGGSLSLRQIGAADVERDGTFQIGRPPPAPAGEFATDFLRVHARGYAAAGRPVDPLPDDIDPPVELILLPAGTLTGTVVDEADRPVAGAEVLYELAGEPRSGVTEEIVRTDAHGHFRFDQVLPTRFGARANPAELRVRHPAYVETRVRLGDAMPVSANAQTRLRVRLERGARVVGTLSDADTGRPLAGMGVRALGDDYPGQEWFALSDREGRYELRVPAGRVRVQPRVPAAGATANYYTVEDERSPFLFTAGAEPVEANFTFRPGHSIRGAVKVVGANAPVGGLCVEAQELEKPVGRAGPLARTGRVEADGTFRIDRLRPGRYGLRVFEPRLGLWQRTDEPVARVDLPAGRDAAGITLEVPPAWSPAALPALGGQVLDEQGRAVPGAKVELRPADVEGTVYTTFADAGGAFRLRGFAPGEAWHLWAWDGRGRRLAVVRLPNPEQWAGPFPLPLGPAATLSGTVRDADGHPIANVGVALCEIVKDRWGTGEVRRTILEAQTDETGRYAIAGVAAPPGRSRLVLTVTSVPPDDEPLGVRGPRARPFTSASYQDFAIESGRETKGLDFVSRQAGDRTVFNVPAH